MVPLAAIASILIYVGWKLCEYKVFTKTYAVGRDQLIIFVITILAILGTDLLSGILIGVAAEVLMLLYLLMPSFRYVLAGRMSAGNSCVLMWANLKSLFQSPVIKVKELKREGVTHYEMTISSLVCFNLLPLDKLLSSLPDKEGVTLIVNESGRIIDHTAMEYLHQFEEECVRDGRVFELLGIENFVQFTGHSLAARMQDAILVKEQVQRSDRELQMERLAERFTLAFHPDAVSTLNQEDFVYLRRGADKEECHSMTGTYLGAAVRLYDYSHTSAPNYHSKHWHTLITSNCAADANLAVPDFVITPGHYLERYLVDYDEVTLPEGSAFADKYRLYGKEGSDPLASITPELMGFMVKHDDCYLEVRKGVMLAFRKDQALADSDEISLLFALTEAFNGSCGNQSGKG